MEQAEKSVGAGAGGGSARRGPGEADRPIALIGGEPITWAEMSGSLSEAAAGVVLEEMVLDRTLAREMRLAGIALEPGAAEGERELLKKTLVEESAVAPEQGEMLLTRVREARGLGEVRFRALLVRNAMLRRLVRDEVTVSEADLEHAFLIKHGPRYRTRLIVTKTEREAAAALERVRGTEGKPGEQFADVAADVSIDASRLRGGMIGAISPADPTYPGSVRNAVRALQAGEVSTVLALDDGYAVVKVEQVLPATGATLEDVRAPLLAEVKLVRERARMERLAARLIKGANVTVLDPAAEWSWKLGAGRPER